MLDRRKRGHISKYSPPSKIFSIIHLSFFSIKLALPGLTDFIIINFDHPGGREHFSRPFHCPRSVCAISGSDLSATIKVVFRRSLPWLVTPSRLLASHPARRWTFG